MTQKIRIKDIASQAGVSPGTVDRVIHKRGNVSAESKAKVMEALDIMEYSPNVLASVLAYNKTWKVAALLPRDNKDPFWSQPKEGLLQALKAVKDYGVSITFYQFYENDKKDFASSTKKILAGDYCSVILAPIFKSESLSFMKALNEKGTPFVQINTYLETSLEKQICYIGQDSYHSGSLAAKLLSFGINSGEKVLIVHLEELVNNSQHLVDKETGFRDYFDSHHKENVEVITGHFANPYNAKGLVDFFRNKLNSNPEIKGIFVTTSRIFHIIPALKQLKREDLKLVGFDLIEKNIKYLRSENIDFLINQNPVRQGYLALISIFNLLIRKRTPASIQHLPLDVVMKENVSYYTDTKFLDVPVVL